MKYDDMINLPHYEPKNHARMSIHNRSAIFAPFSALAGFQEAIMDSSTFLEEKRELGIDELEVLNEKILKIKNIIDEKPVITLTYFLENKSKNGGIYVTVTKEVMKIDELKKELVLMNNVKVPFVNILDISLHENI